MLLYIHIHTKNQEYCYGKHAVVSGIWNLWL